MQTRASCASKSSRAAKRTSLVATTGTPRATARASDPAMQSSSPGRPCGELEVVAVAEHGEPGSSARAASSSRPASSARPTSPSRAPESATSRGRLRIEPGAIERRSLPALPLEIGARHEAREVAVAAVVLAEQHQPARLGPLASSAAARPRRRAASRRARARPVELHQREQVGLVGDRHRRHPMRAQRRPVLRGAPSRRPSLAVDAEHAVDQRVLGVYVQWTKRPSVSARGTRDCTARSSAVDGEGRGAAAPRRGPRSGSPCAREAVTG